MNGQTAQLGFYYQNLYCIYLILTSLQDKINKVYIDFSLNKLKPGLRSKKEVDIIIEIKKDNENKWRFYEVKSGLEFTRSDLKIKESILTLFEVFKKFSDSPFSYFLIIHPGYSSKITEVIFKIKKIRETKRKSKVLKEICEKWKITNEELFLNFCKKLEINSENDLDKLKLLCLGKIEEYIKEMIFNPNYALTKEDLLNRFIHLIFFSIATNEGIINIEDFLKEFANWCAINEVAYQTSQNHKPKEMIEEAKRKFLKKFQQYSDTPLLIEENINTLISEK